MTENADGWIRHLDGLPFVKGAKVRHRKAGDLATLRTPEGTWQCPVRWVRTNMTAPLAQRLTTEAGEDSLILAPHVGRDIGMQLATADVNFVDLAGNCYINLGGRYVARVQGNRPLAQPTEQKGMRPAAYKVLLAWLARPALMGEPIRAVADQAGVSRQAVLDMRARAQELGIALTAGKSLVWNPATIDQAINLMVTGYATTLRPKLLLDRYRAQETEPKKGEAALARTLKREGIEYRWGGGTAAFKLQGHYHGPRTTVHLGTSDPNVARKLRLVRDPEGPVHLLLAPTPLTFEGQATGTVHPLLIYLELLTEGNERAREAAKMLADEWLTRETFE